MERVSKGSISKGEDERYIIVDNYMCVVKIKIGGKGGNVLTKTTRIPRKIPQMSILSLIYIT